MKLNLKRALKLRKELEVTLAQFALPSLVTLSLLVPENVNDPLAAINVGRQDSLKALEEYNQLSQILADVRTKVAKENATFGVEDLLAEIAHTDRLIGLARKISASEITPPIAQLSAEIALLHKDLADGGQPDAYGRRSRTEKTVNVALTSEMVRDQAKQTVIELKRVRESQDDKRAYINGSFTIEIADETANLLRKIGLL